MTSDFIVTLGPEGSDSYLAACQYAPDAKYILCNRISEVLELFARDKEGLALLPVYNTRAGEFKEYFRLIAAMQECYWIDNLVLPIHLSLAALELPDNAETQIHTIVGRSSVFQQCAEYIEEHFPEAHLMAVHNIERAMSAIAEHQKLGTAIIETEELLRNSPFKLIAREVVSHNRTRFAVLSKHPVKRTGYDATAVITQPLKDRVGMLVDILGEFTRRGVNILDLQTENDIKTQKLRIYVEIEGHAEDTSVKNALHFIASQVIQEEDALKVLGSFPRVDMRVKRIKSFGFIGSGDMSIWFAERLSSEGYETIITGRTSPIAPAEMIEKVDVVVVCVPISATSETIRSYGKYLKDGQALIILAGESETTLETALQSTSEGVEIMFVHNLWGPQAVTMKDKNVSVVRTYRSGSHCSEFEAFLYKHGADIIHDSAQKHDLLMGVGQKLPTTISVALAMTLREHAIDCKDIGTHSTLTSLYGILSMARVHNQNPRTYAEIMTTKGDGTKIVNSFARNLLQLTNLAKEGDIDALLALIQENRSAMPESFLKKKMVQARAVDEILSQPSMKDENI